MLFELLEVLRVYSYTLPLCAAITGVSKSLRPYGYRWKSRNDYTNSLRYEHMFSSVLFNFWSCVATEYLVSVYWNETALDCILL